MSVERVLTEENFYNKFTLKENRLINCYFMKYQNCLRIVTYLIFVN